MAAVRDDGLNKGDDFLNEEQRAVFDFVVNGFPGAEEKLLYIDGPAGTGKTFLINCLYRYITQVAKDRVICCAYTGIASTLLPGGVTIHSAFQIPVSDNVEYVQKGMQLRWNKDTEWLESIRQLQWIIFDECSMVPRSLIDLIDEELRRICCLYDAPFAGKKVIFSGDFRQLLPVVTSGASKKNEETGTLKHSTLWPLTTRMRLTRNVRAKEDAKYAEFLLTIGNGDMTAFTVPSDMRHSNLVAYVYDQDDKTTRLRGNDVILTATNADADKLNQIVFDSLPSDEHLTIFLCTDTLYELNVKDYDKLSCLVNPVLGLKMCKTNKQVVEDSIAQFLRSFDHPDLQPSTLHAKPGCLVVMTKNMDQQRRLCNGTRLCVTSTGPGDLQCARLGYDAIDETITIGRVECLHRLSAANMRAAGFAPQPHKAYVVVRNQFPLRLSFAMTITKSQGQTFDKLGLYLPKYTSIFTHGHLYTALSRSTKRDNVKIYSVGNKVRNIVNKDILLS